VRYPFSGSRLQVARDHAGFTSEKVASRVRRSLTVVQYAETDDHEPGIDKGAVLVAAVGVRVDDPLEQVDDEAEAAVR
jgi:ribosome-binding protein aMBF1 (putative translation factor)